MIGPWEEGLLCAYVDGELDDGQALAVERLIADHPEAGPALRRLFDSRAMLRAALGTEPDGPLPAALAEPNAPPAGPPPPPQPPARRRWWTWFNRATAPAGAEPPLPAGP